MIKWCAQRKLKAAIKYHYTMRSCLMYGRHQDPTSAYDYMEHTDELWHRAHCEYRCAQRLEKLLMKYQ